MNIIWAARTVKKKKSIHSMVHGCLLTLLRGGFIMKQLILLF